MKKISLFAFLLLIFNLFPMALPALAASSGDIVINEIAWMGSIDNSNDEYLELYNTTGSAIDLTGWYITDDVTTTYTIDSGSIPANGFFLIEDNEDSVSTKTADAVIGLSLANTGDALVLYDANGTAIDTVNSSGGAWVAGDNTSKSTMERIDASVSGDDSSNWSSNQSGSGDLGSAGGAIEGTPGTVNSASTFSGTTIDISGTDPQAGQNWNVTIDVTDATNIFSYGLELQYDHSQLSLIGVNQGDFLNENQTVSTSFQYGMDSINNTLVAGEARTQTAKTTVSGNGTLVTLTFQVNGNNGDTGTLNILGSSFLGGLQGDSTAVFHDKSYKIGGSGTGGNSTVQNLQVAEGTERYSMTLTWEAPLDGADSYNVYRTNPHGAYELIGNTTNLTFTDDDTTDGGDIIPNLEYQYSVTALSGSTESDAVVINGTDTRGLKGDNNRSDRVDARDLENLGLHFSETDSDTGFDRRIDTSYDGYIDGDDLIDIGANWAQNYL